MDEDDGEGAAWRYMTAARPVQGRVNQTLTQIAGFALLLMTSSRPASLAEGALIGAHEASLQAVEAVRALPAPEGAAHHFHHLSAAAGALREACASALSCVRAGATDNDRDALVRALRAATHHLRTTSKLLPGFELVDLKQACCATHAPQRWLCEA